MHRHGFGFRRPRANLNIQPALLRAHELMNLGNYAEAAITFENLAQGAEERMGLRAPFLFLQAGYARIQLKQNAIGMRHFRHGLELFTTSGRHHQLYRAGTRIIEELRARGLVKEAQEIASLVHLHIPAISEGPTQRGPEPDKVALPTRCTSCGSPIRSDEVEWIDAITAECSFCGSPIRAEE